MSSKGNNDNELAQILVAMLTAEAQERKEKKKEKDKIFDDKKNILKLREAAFLADDPNAIVYEDVETNAHCARTLFENIINKSKDGKGKDDIRKVPRIKNVILGLSITETYDEVKSKLPTVNGKEWDAYKTEQINSRYRSGWSMNTDPLKGRVEKSGKTMKIILEVDKDRAPEELEVKFPNAVNDLEAMKTLLTEGGKDDFIIYEEGAVNFASTLDNFPDYIVEIPDMTEDLDECKTRAKSKLKTKLNLKNDEAYKALMNKENRMWHEDNDMKREMFVKSAINEYFPHFGGRAEFRLYVRLLTGEFVSDCKEVGNCKITNCFYKTTYQENEKK